MDELIEKNRKFVKNGHKWSKMAPKVKNGHKWPKLAKIEKYPENLKKDRIQSS